MSNELVPSSGGALVPSTGTAVSEQVGDDTSPGNAAQIAWSRRQPESIANLRREMLRDMVIDGIGEHEIDRCLPIIEDHAPAMMAALRTSNRQEQARLADSLRDRLVSHGVSPERIERMRVILHRYGQESERALIGPGARDSALIDEMRELDSLMAKPGSRYWKGEDADRLQRRWRELHDLGVRVDGERSTADADVKKRIGEIESLMGDYRSAYYRGSHADALQREYRSLIERAQHNERQ
jgi:hypothetical protein